MHLVNGTFNDEASTENNSSLRDVCILHEMIAKNNLHPKLTLIKIFDN